MWNANVKHQLLILASVVDTTSLLSAATVQTKIVKLPYLLRINKHCLV